MCTNSAYFWYRKRRIYGLSDGQKYFVYSVNVYPKLDLEHFNVYFRLVPWTGHALAALQMLVSSRFGPCLASYADILLARHALLPNERLLKRAAINVDQSQRTSKAGKCVLCPLGKFARHAETNTMDDCVVFQRVPARGTSW